MGYLRNAGMITGAVLAGVAAGMALICLRLGRVERLSQAVSDGNPGVDQLHPLLRGFGDAGPALSVYRFPLHLVLDPGAWAVTAIGVYVGVSAGLVAARRAPLWLAATGFRNTPSTSRGDIRSAWRQFLDREAARRPSAFFLMMVMALGFAAMIVAEVHAIVQTGALGLRTPPRPVLGVCAWSDAAWLLAVAGAAPAGAIVGRARGALRSDPITRLRWCYACGYPRLATGEEQSQPRPCSECGSTCTPSAGPGADRSARFLKRWAVIASLVMLALVVHAASPWVPGIVGRVAGGIAVAPAHDVALVPYGAVVLIERSQERVWLYVGDADGEQRGPAASWLHGRLEPAADSGGAGVSWSLPLTDGIVSPESIDTGEGRVIQITVEWQSEFGLAHVYLAPADAVSIRAVEPSSAVPFGGSRKRPGDLQQRPEEAGEVLGDAEQGGAGADVLEGDVP